MDSLLQFIEFKDLTSWSVSHLVENQFNYNKKYELVRIGDFLKRNKTQIILQDEIEYKRVTIKLNNGGVFLRDKKYGKEIGTKKQYLIKKGQFLLSKIDARNGAFGVVTDEVDGAIITADFFAYDIDIDKIDPYFLVLTTTTEQFKKFAQSASSGTTGRQRINEKRFLDTKIPLPPLDKQKEIVGNVIQYEKKLNELRNEYINLVNEFENELFVQNEKKEELLQFIEFKDLSSWSVKNYLSSEISSIYKIVKLGDFIKEEKEKIKPFEYPNDEFKILGVNNKIGLFDNEIKLGKNINQAYKIVKDGFLAYNPYRVNVGSIGLKTNKQKFNLISPAYVVFSCKNGLLPEYLFLIFKMDTFNKIINENTRGSVRQILAFDILENLKIPLPPLDKQKEMIEKIQTNLKEQEKAIKNKKLALKEFEMEIFEKNIK